MKNNLQRNKSRVKKANNQITDLEHKEAKNNQSEQQEEKRIQKNEDSISSLWDNFEDTNVHIMGVQGDEIEQEIENLLEKIMTENFPNLVKEMDIQVQKAQRVPNKMNPKRTTPRYMIIKMPKNKDKENFKSSKQKSVSYL